MRNVFELGLCDWVHQMKVYRAKVINGKLIVSEPTDLPDGSEVDLIVSDSDQSSSSSVVERSNQKEETSDSDSSSFDKFRFQPNLYKAIRRVGFTRPTQIQNQAIPMILHRQDVIGVAKTGSGKTASFALPIIDRLLGEMDKPALKVLIVAPTRELAAQIGENIDMFTSKLPVRQVTIFGGVKQFHQVKAMNKIFQILVATPGRLLDLIGQQIISLDEVHTLVLDEADRMLDMGFLPDVKKIIEKTPEDRQTLLFTATMPMKIQELAKKFMLNPVEVRAHVEAIPVEMISQSIFLVEKKDKLRLLEFLLDEEMITRALVFTRTKHGANKLARILAKNSLQVDAIHGNKSQASRERALKNFKQGNIDILVATDIAARGLDVDDITHVVNYDMPSEQETYMHRIGRTARAGASGHAISLCSYEERRLIRSIEKHGGFNIPIMSDYPHKSPIPYDPLEKYPKNQKQKSRGLRNRNNFRLKSKRQKSRKS